MTRSRSIAWIVWAIAAIFYAYQYILRVMPNIMMDDILQQFNIDAVIFGQFSGIYYIGYSLMHIPIGILLDRFGPKQIMPIFILMTVIGLLPLLFAKFWLYPVIGRFFIGMGSSAAILGTFKIIRLHFAEDKFTRLLSLAVTIGLIGAIYGGGPVNYMCEVLGYQAVIGIFAVAGMVLAIIAYLIIPALKSTERPLAFSDIMAVFSNKKVIAVCVSAGLMVGPLEGFADVWGTGFLKHVYGFEGSIAASLPSMIFVGMCFGAPLLSLVAEKTKHYFGTIIAAGVVMAISFIALIAGKLTIASMSVVFVAVGLCSAYQIIAIYKASTYVKEQVVSLTTAIANMIIMIFGYLFHTLIGWIVNLQGGPTEKNALLAGIAIIPITLALGIIGFCGLLIKEKA